MYSLLAGPLTVERITVRIRGLPSALRDTKITLLSDLHYDGLRLSEDLLESAIQRSNQEQPDIVVLTGDHVTDDPAPAPALAQHLCQLSSRYGVYACLGNHDVVTPAAKMAVTDALEQANIHVLWNAIAYPWGESLPLVGLADFWSKEFRPQQVLSELTAEVPRIVLSHNPDTARPLQKFRVDLQLSGHTHGGQIHIPGWGAGPHILQQWRKQLPIQWKFLVPFRRECAKVVRHWEWAQGWHQIGQNQLYVNRGLGTYFPGRWFCPPELTVITLTTASRT